MGELARTAPRGGMFRVYLVGGGTAVLAGWRSATIDADLCADRDEVFRDIQGIKERLQLNIRIRPAGGLRPAERFYDLRNIPAAPCIELVPDDLDVIAGRVQGDAEGLGNLAVGPPFVQ